MEAGALLSKKGVLTISGSSADIHRELEQIELADKKAEGLKKSGCIVMGTSVALIFLGGFAFNQNRYILYYFAALVIALIVGVIIYYRGDSGDVEDERYQLISKLQRFISCDCEEDGEYEYRLDLRPYDGSNFYLRKTKFGSFFSRPSGKVEFYRIPLMNTTLKLRDGSSLFISVDRETAKKTVTKYGRSGKLKTKVKRKYRDTYSVVVKLPKGKPEPPQTIPPLSQADKFSYKAHRNGVRASTTIKAGISAGPSADILLRLLVHVYYFLIEKRQQPA